MENVVYSHLFKGGFVNGQKLDLKGTVSPDPKRISINLQDKDFIAENVTLHIDLRFDYGGDKETIVCNDKDDGQLGEELRPTKYFPFEASKDYNIIISRNVKIYTVSVDGMKLFQYEQRAKPETPLWLVVCGDTSVTDCTVKPLP